MRGSLRSELYYIFSVIFSRIPAFIILPILSEKISIESYGIYEYFLLIAALATSIGLFQFDSAFLKFADKSNEARGVLLNCLVLTSVISLISSVLIVAFLGKGKLLDSISFELLLVFIFSFTSNLYYLLLTYLRYLEKAQIYFAINLFGGCIYVLLGLLALYLMNSWYWIVLAQVGTNLILILYLSFKMELFIKPSLQWSSSLLHYTYPGLIGLLATWFASNFIRVELVQLDRLDVLGFYSASIKIAGIFLILSQAIRLSWQPYVFRNFNDSLKLKSKLDQLLFLATTGLFLLYFLAPILLKYLYPGYSIDPELLGILLLTFYINTVAQLLGFGPDVKSKLVYSSVVSFFRAIIVVFIVSSFLQHVQLIEFLFYLYVLEIFNLIVVMLVTKRLVGILPISAKSWIFLLVLIVFSFSIAL